MSIRKYKINNPIKEIPLLIAVVLSLVALISMAVSGTLLLSSVDLQRRILADEPLERQLPINGEDYEQLTEEDPGPEDDGKGILAVGLLFRRLEPSEDRLDALLTLTVTRTDLLELATNGKPFKTDGDNISLNRGYESASIIVSFRYLTANLVAPQSLSVPITDLLTGKLQGGDRFATSIPVTLRVEPQSRGYPFDHYVFASLPTFFWSSGKGNEPNIDIRTVLYCRAGAGLAGMKIGIPEVRQELVFGALIERDRETRLFVSILTLSPLLLFLVIAHQVFQRETPQKPGSSNLVPLEAVVGLIAIVPLRQVLVPANIPGLTVVDVILGGQLVLFLVVISIGYFFWSKFPTADSAEEVTAPPQAPDSAKAGAPDHH